MFGLSANNILVHAVSFKTVRKRMPWKRSWDVFVNQKKMAVYKFPNGFMMSGEMETIWQWPNSMLHVALTRRPSSPKDALFFLQGSVCWCWLGYLILLQLSEMVAQSVLTGAVRQVQGEQAEEGKEGDKRQGCRLVHRGGHGQSAQVEQETSMHSSHTSNIFQWYI